MYDFDLEHEAMWDEETDIYTHILKTTGRQNGWMLTLLIGKILERMRELKEKDK